MKHRCQCGKPQVVRSVPYIGDMHANWYEPMDCLHFKAADRYCERCGAALCEDCCEIVYLDDAYGVVKDHKTYCRTCAELEGK